jgi:hypothetical protein
MDREQLQRVFDARIQKAAEESAAEMAKRAKYKIQIWFRSDRSMHKPVTFSMSFWESGKRLHGGGDELLFICRRHEQAPKIKPFAMANIARKSISQKGCDGLISGDHVSPEGIVVCPHCGISHRSDQIGDAIMFPNVTIDSAAKILAQWWRKIGSNADIYAKYSPTDPRTVMMSRAYSPRKAREKKGLTIYPLGNILKDTLNGASLESRMRAFITA